MLHNTAATNMAPTGEPVSCARATSRTHKVSVNLVLVPLEVSRGSSDYNATHNEDLEQLDAQNTTYAKTARVAALRCYVA